MKHRIAASARTIGSKIRWSLDLGFLAGFVAVAEAAVCVAVEAGVVSVAEATGFALSCLKKAYTLTTASFNFMLLPCNVYTRKFCFKLRVKTHVFRASESRI